MIVNELPSVLYSNTIAAAVEIDVDAHESSPR